MSQAGQFFAPFNVQVKQLSGAGKYDQGNGNTTIFIGGNAHNVDGNGLKTLDSSTPAEFTDNPGTVLGLLHAPDSEPYHLAFVDPMAQNVRGGTWTNRQTTGQISLDIAHEAGHTFGLAHVLTGGTADPDGSVTSSSFPGDVMSYDALGAPNPGFLNQTFPVTDVNYNPTTRGLDHDGAAMYAMTYHQQFNPFSPSTYFTDPVAVATQQNSYTYLQAVLGANPHQMTGKVENVQANVGWQFHGVVANFRDANAARAADSYTATISWGNGYTSSGQVIANRDGSYRVVGTNTYGALPWMSSTYAVGVRITDANGYTLYLTGAATVTQPANDLTGYGEAISATAGQGRNFAVAMFSDPDGRGQASDYKVQIRWGDGSVTTGEVTRNQDGTYMVSGWNYYATSGTYTITVDITDAGGTLSLTSTAFVSGTTFKSSGHKGTPEV
jgi:hypothetical protein